MATSSEQKCANLSKGDVVAEVRKKLGRPILAEIIDYVKTKAPKIMGRHKPDGALENIVYGTLYKDLFFTPYDCLAESFKFGYKISKKSWYQNVQRMRPLLAAWAREHHIELYNEAHWKRAAKDLNANGVVKGATHLMDSTDIHIQRRGKKRGPKSDLWSGKENRPSLRFMTLEDGYGLINELWGGYSPKIYDSHFVQSQQQFFTGKMKGAKIVADQHFSSVHKYFANPEFVTKLRELKSKDEKGRKRKRDEFDSDEEDDDEDMDVRAKTREQHNQDVAEVRGPVEGPFGHIKRKFASLKEPWAESLEQLTHLTTFAVGVYNYVVEQDLKKNKRVRR